MNSGICILCSGKCGILLHSNRECGHFPKYMHFIGSVMLRNIASSNFPSLVRTIITLSSSASEGFFREMIQHLHLVLAKNHLTKSAVR